MWKIFKWYTIKVPERVRFQTRKYELWWAGLPKSYMFRNFDGTSSLTQMSFALMTIYENTIDLSRAHLIWWLALKKRICKSYVNPSSALVEEVALKEIPSYKFCVWILVSAIICRWAYTKWLDIWRLVQKTNLSVATFPGSPRQVLDPQGHPGREQSLLPQDEGRLLPVSGRGCRWGLTQR